MTNPTLITTPFAENGDKNIIPESVGANPQNATMQAGFPPVTQQKISEGGIPPERDDFNGILNLYGQHIVHLNKGLPYEFDQDFANKIGGYPLNARLMLDNGDIVQSVIPNNTNNPNSDLTGWINSFSAKNIKDESGLNQEQINKISKSVPLVADLRQIKAKDGDIVETKGHSKIGIGGGVFKFEALSSKLDNNGAYIASNVSAGTWTLISNHTIEQWGVLSSGDQANNIQKAIDFYMENNIKEFGFEKSEIYSIGSPIRFKQRKNTGSDSDTYADPKLGCIWNFNGAVLKATIPNMACVVISRDCVQINNFNATSDSLTGIIGIYNGLDVENNDSTLRRSSMRMILMNPSFDHVQIGMKFEPAETKFGKQWGSFYHVVINPTGTFVDFLYDFRQSKGAGDCSNTRCTFIGTKHVGGSCTIYGEALESSVFIGLDCEFINRPHANLPNGEAVALYLPYGTPSDFQANRGNKFINFNIEVCTNYINVDAPETHIDGFFQSATNPNSQAWIWNNAYDRVSSLQGGQLIKAYNKTPRLGLSQVNDDGTSANLYIEGSDTHGNYKIVADGRIEIPALSTGSIRATGGDIGFSSTEGEKNLAITFNPSIDFAYLAAANGIVGFTGTLAPALDNWSNIGTTGNRIKKIFAYSSNLSGLPVHADNTSAIGSGLVVGDLYRTSTGQVMVVF